MPKYTQYFHPNIIYFISIFLFLHLPSDRKIFTRKIFSSPFPSFTLVSTWYLITVIFITSTSNRPPLIINHGSRRNCPSLRWRTSGSSQRPIRHAKDLAAQDYFRPGQIKFRHERGSAGADAPAWPCVRNEIEDGRAFANLSLHSHPPSFPSTLIYVDDSVLDTGRLHRRIYIYISPFHPSFNPNVRPIDFATKFRRFNGIRIYYESKKRFFVFLFLFFLYRTEFSTLNLCIIYNNFGWDERKNVILYSSSSIHLKRFKGSNWFYSIKRPFIYPS